MNPTTTFPAIPYTAAAIATIGDATIRQYLTYDSWLYHERVRNWNAYTSHLQYTQQQQQEQLRIRILRQQYETKLAHFYEYQRQALEAQQALEEHKRQKAQEEAEMESYLKEIEEVRQQQESEAEQDRLEQLAEEKAAEWNEAAEKFSSAKTARRDRQRENRRERRSLARYEKAMCKFLFDATLGTLYEDEDKDNEQFPRTETYNADKPSRAVRYVGADKRKGQLFHARRQFGSGWAKQQQ